MELEDAKVWFVRFGMDKHCRTLACGNRKGEVFLWDPHDLQGKAAAKLKPGTHTTVSFCMHTRLVHTVQHVVCM